MIRAFASLLILLTLSIHGAAQEPILLKHDGWVAAVAFSPDGKTLASAGADNVVRLWEVGTWKPKGVLKGHTDCICAIAFDRKGDVLVTGSLDGTVKIWSVDDLKADRFTGRNKGAVLCIFVESGFAPLLLAGGVDGMLRPQLVPEDNNPPLIRHKSWINGLAVQNGIATASSDGTVGLLTDSKNGKLGKPFFLEGGAGEVRSVAFSPDGKLLAAGNRYHTVRVWDVESKKEIKTLAGHMSDVWSIAFSPDGKTLAAADTDWKKPSKVKLWNTSTWQERGSVDCPGEILSIAYSPKGDWLAVGSWDKTVQVFAVKR